MQVCVCVCVSVDCLDVNLWHAFDGPVVYDLRIVMVCRCDASISKYRNLGSGVHIFVVDVDWIRLRGQSESTRKVNRKNFQFDSGVHWKIAQPLLVGWSWTFSWMCWRRSDSTVPCEWRPSRVCDNVWRHRTLPHDVQCNCNGVGCDNKAIRTLDDDHDDGPLSEKSITNTY